MACDLNLPASDDKTRACRCAFSCSLFRMRFRQCPSHTSPQSRRSNGSRWTQSFQSGKKKQDWFEPVSWVLQDNTVGIWNTTIWNLCFLQVRFKLVWFSNGRALAMAIATVPTIWKPDLSKPRHICPDFKWFLTKWRPFVWISVVFSIQNPDHLQPNLFLTIWNPNLSGFQIPTVSSLNKYKIKRGFEF